MFPVRNISQWELRAGNKYPSFPSPSVGLFWGWPPILSQKVHTHFEFRLYPVVTSVTQPFGPPSLCFLYLPTPSLCFLQYCQRNDLSWSFCLWLFKPRHFLCLRHSSTPGEMVVTRQKKKSSPLTELTFLWKLQRWTKQNSKTEYIRTTAECISKTE